MAKAQTSNRTTTHPGSKRRLKIWFAFVVLFMAWALYTLFSQMEQRGETEMKRLALQETLAEAEAESARLQKQVERLNDSEYIRELARKHGYILPGEQPIQVTEAGE
ncbi:septum formation initiator family protein [Paenibacillus sambharensis]|nr:septum formation initiator family protein [Paenibacillus sambharensis]